MQCVLQLKHLKKVVLEAKASFDGDLTSRNQMYNTVFVLHGDNQKKLSLVLDLGKQIKKGFEEPGREVEVQVRLRYAGLCKVTAL
jgi:hypothetical protein